MKKTISKNLPYAEGNLFSIPLKNGGYAVGVISRVGVGGRILFGYFFGPKRNDILDSDSLQSIEPKDAVLIGRFGDLGILNGSWRIIGTLNSWNRDLWFTSRFIRVDIVSNESFVVEYSEKNLSVELSCTLCDSSMREALPKDGLMGYGAVEIILTKLLDK